MKKENGFILLVTLIFIFVITLIVMSGSEDIVLDEKMQNHFYRNFQLFLTAEWSVAEARSHFTGHPVAAPYSPFTVDTEPHLIQTDECGNQLVEMQTTASDAQSTVLLNSQDIFARVPIEKGCPVIPVHQTIWWQM